MTEPKPKLQLSRSPISTRSPGLDLDELTQQVDPPLAADDTFADEPTLVGLDFDETRKRPK